MTPVPHRLWITPRRFLAQIMSFSNIIAVRLDDKTRGVLCLHGRVHEISMGCFVKKTIPMMVHETFHRKLHGRTRPWDVRS